MFIKILGLAILTAFMSGCTDDWVSWDEHTIEKAEYTGVNTARVIYKAMDGQHPFHGNGVRIYNRDFTKEYTIRKESTHKYSSQSRYRVDITVEPNWAPGDYIHVSGISFVFGGSAGFEVPIE